MADVFQLPVEFIEPSKSVEKLNALKFDPIARLTVLYDTITQQLYEMTTDNDGNPRKKFSQVAFTALISTQAKIANDLMRYGYMRVPEVQQIEQINAQPISIILTDTGDDD